MKLHCVLHCLLRHTQKYVHSVVFTVVFTSMYRTQFFFKCNIYVSQFKTEKKIEMVTQREKHLHNIIASIGLEGLVRSLNPILDHKPPCHLDHATKCHICSLNISRDGDNTTSLHSPSQYLTKVSVKKFLPVSNWNDLWHSLSISGPLILSLVAWEKRSLSLGYNLLSGSCREW